MIKIKDDATRYEVVWENSSFKIYRYGAFVEGWLGRYDLSEEQAKKKAEEILAELVESVPPDADGDWLYDE